MRIYNLLNESHVLFNLKSEKKKELLQEFVSALKTRGLVIKEKKILEEVLRRESLCSTGLEKGIAIPHALTDELEKPVLALALIKKGVNFESADQKPTYILFLLIGNKKNPGLQLKILAHICRLIKETKFVEKVRKSKSAHEICQILEEEEGKIT